VWAHWRRKEHAHACACRSGALSCRRAREVRFASMMEETNQFFPPARPCARIWQATRAHVEGRIAVGGKNGLRRAWVRQEDMVVFGGGFLPHGVPFGTS
jgi:hypothetical protein